jgi:hypothetical protein
MGGVLTDGKQMFGLTNHHVVDAYISQAKTMSDMPICHPGPEGYSPEVFGVAKFNAYVVGFYFGQLCCCFFFCFFLLLLLKG